MQNISPPPEGALRVQLLCFRLPAMQCPGSSCRLPQNPCSQLPSNGVFQTFNLLFIAATKSTRVEVKFRFTNERERLPCAVKGKKISACWLRRKSSEAAANGVKSVRGDDYQQTSCKNGPETKKWYVSWQKRRFEDLYTYFSTSAPAIGAEEIRQSCNRHLSMADIHFYFAFV